MKSKSDVKATADKAKSPAEKPISLAPLSTTDALRGLLQVKPMKSEEIKKASKKRVDVKTSQAAQSSKKP